MSVAYLNMQVNKHAVRTIGCFGGRPGPSAVQEEGTATRGNTWVCAGPQSPTLRQHPASTVQWTEGGKGKIHTGHRLVCFQPHCNVLTWNTDDKCDCGTVYFILNVQRNTFMSRSVENEADVHVEMYILLKYWATLTKYQWLNFVRWVEQVR